MNKKHLTYLKKKYKFISSLDDIKCGDGWKSLIYNMCKSLKDEDPPSDFCITHMGERFGSLEVHTKNGNIRTQVVIRDSKDLSYDICDECGNNKDLEMCEKCKTPVVEYPDETEQDNSNNVQCGPCNKSCGCP